MDKSVFEKYIQEMRRMQSAAIPSPSVTPVTEYIPATKPTVEPTIPPENGQNMSGEGFLVVNVTSVRGLFPVEGAEVTVFTGSWESPTVIAQATTDQSGKTPPISLPAPAARFSEAPDPAERPYAYYNVHTVEDGFREYFNYNVAVFDGVTSLQNITLEPMTSEISQNRPIVIDEFENYSL